MTEMREEIELAMLEQQMREDERERLARMRQRKAELEGQPYLKWRLTRNNHNDIHKFL